MNTIPKLSLNVLFRLQLVEDDDFTFPPPDEAIQKMEEKEAVQEVNRAVNRWLYSDAVLTLDA